MILVTQSINDFPQNGKSLETRSRERLTRVVKRKPLKFKSVYRNIKLQGKKHHKRVICYVCLNRSIRTAGSVDIRTVN